MSKYQAPAAGRVGDSSHPISVHNSHCFNLAQSVQQQLTMVSPKQCLKVEASKSSFRHGTAETIGRSSNF